MTTVKTCSYCNPDGWRCSEPANKTGLCYWHDPEVDKSQDNNVKEALEKWAQGGKPLDGFQLARTQLEDINLVHKGNKSGYKCREADFYRANLRNAHCFGLDLRGSSLMKSSLVGANLHCAQLENSNLLGADLSRARLENIVWGSELQQERRALEAIQQKKTHEAISLCQEAEEVARIIRKQCEKEGLFEIAGHFLKKEMRFRRYQMPIFSSKRIISKGVDLFCGYGESPIRVVIFSVCLILACALVYFFLGTTASNPIDPNSSGITAVLLELLNAIYFSVVTFTTLGYGDIAPLGLARVIAAIEAFLGSFTMALFVVVFVKKMTR